jgi:hypothetical protein
LKTEMATGLSFNGPPGTTAGPHSGALQSGRACGTRQVRPNSRLAATLVREHLMSSPPVLFGRLEQRSSSHRFC